MQAPGSLGPRVQKSLSPRQSNLNLFRSLYPFSGLKAVENGMIYSWIPNHSLSRYAHLAISPYDIEHREINKDGSDLYSWITDDSSALSEESRVYLLPSVEYDFWNKILNKKTGYLSVQS